MLRRVADRNSMDIEEELKSIQSEMDKLDIDDVEPPADFLQNFIDEMDCSANQKPLKFGLKSLDKFTGGVRPKELTTLAGRPASGKTAFADQIALNAAGQEGAVSFIGNG